VTSSTQSDGVFGRDLDWLAFQYVAGELSAEAAVLFEARLQSSTAACEAVERAVALGECVSLAFQAAESSASPDAPKTLQCDAAGSVRPAHRTHGTATRASFGRMASVTVTACAILGALLVSFRDDGAVVRSTGLLTENRSALDGQPVTETAQLAPVESLFEAWTETRETVDAVEDELLSGEFVADMSELRVDVTGDVPDWMFVAVELSHQMRDGMPQPEVLEN
jgi:hypothetical protein